MGSIDARDEAAAMDILIIGAGRSLNSYTEAFSKPIIKEMELSHHEAVLSQESQVFRLPCLCTRNVIIGTLQCLSGMIPSKLLALSLA